MYKLYIEDLARCKLSLLDNFTNLRALGFITARITTASSKNSLHRHGHSYIASSASSKPERTRSHVPYHPRLRTFLSELN
ncbi:hypothetical protein N7504_001658 [Penicillium tannophilum]|nr:hypothetical protein N7504_001658 [Penicillium tannophilum]